MVSFLLWDYNVNWLKDDNETLMIFIIITNKDKTLEGFISYHLWQSFSERNFY